MTAPEKKNFWKQLFSKEDAMEEARAYGSLTFFKKSKNVFVVFILAISVLSIGLAMFANMANFVLADVLLGIIIYLILLPFVYFNHRWAMVVVGLLYAADKLLLIAQGFGTPVSQLIFLAVAGVLTYRSVLVATYLKKQKSEG